MSLESGKPFRHDQSEPSSPIPTGPRAMRSPSGSSRSSFSGDSYRPRLSRAPTSHPRNYSNAGDDSQYYGSAPSPPTSGSRKRTFSDSDSGYDSRGRRPSKRSSRTYPYPQGNHLKRTMSKYRYMERQKEDFKLGTIIRCIHAEEAYNGGNHLRDQHKAFGPNGETLCVKERPMIIIARHPTNWVALPLFTFQGRGIEQKPDALQYISIRDHRSTQPFKAQSPWEPLETEWLGDEIHLFDPTCVAMLTYPECRDYSVPAIIQGQLQPESTNRLIKLHRAYSAYVGVDLEDEPSLDKLLQEHKVDLSHLEFGERLRFLLYRERKAAGVLP